MWYSSNVGHRFEYSCPSRQFFYFKLKRLALSSSTLCKTHKGRNDLSTDVNEFWPFQITSRRPYCCPKTIKRRPCWCPKPVLWEWNSFLMQTLSFAPINMHRCWLCEWKRSIPGRIKVYPPCSIPSIVATEDLPMTVCTVVPRYRKIPKVTTPRKEWAFESSDKISQVLANAKSSDPPKVRTSKVIFLLARNNRFPKYSYNTTNFTKLIRDLFFNCNNDICHSFM